MTQSDHSLSPNQLASRHSVSSFILSSIKYPIKCSGEGAEHWKEGLILGANGVVEEEVQRRLNRIQKQNQEARLRGRPPQAIILIPVIKLPVEVWEVDVAFEFFEDAQVGRKCVSEAGPLAASHLLVQVQQVD